jgi:uncharacterized membrane protein (DUF106 family)
MYMQIILLVSYSITILSLIIFFLLLHKYLNTKHKNYVVHSITKMLSVLAFFLFIEGLYSSLLYTSQYNLISPGFYYALSGTYLEVVPRVGIFITAIFIIHFLMEKRIEQFKNNEDTLGKLQKLNHELEKRAKELQTTQNTLQTKVLELERFNLIAKDREAGMLDLIKKIEILETKLKKK